MNKVLDEVYNQIYADYKKTIDLYKRGLVSQEEVEYLEEKLIELECMSGI